MERIKIKEDHRIESGPIQFEYESRSGLEIDWPGYFLRGDDAMQLACAIQSLEDKLPTTGIDMIYANMLKAFMQDIFDNVVQKPKQKPPQPVSELPDIHDQVVS